MLRDTSDHFEFFTSTVHGRSEHPEYPEGPEYPEYPEYSEHPGGSENPLGEPWYPIKEEEKEITEIRS